MATVQKLKRGSRVKAFLNDWILQNTSLLRMQSRILNLQRGSPKSVWAYSQAIHDFCVYMGNVNADQVLEGFMKTAERDEKTVRNIIQRFIDARSGQVAPKTLAAKVSALKRWFKANDFSIHWDLLETGSTQTIMEDRCLDVEELRRILAGDKLSLRDRAFILLAATSGLRGGTLLTLHVGDVDFDVEAKLKKSISSPMDGYLTPEQQTRLRGIAMILVRMAPGRKLRGQNSYFSFVTSETVKAIREYFDWRKRSGETLTAESWLIGKEQPHYSSEPMHIVPMSHHWRLILERNGFLANGQSWHPLHLHTLRKFHTTMTSSVKGCAYVWRGQKQGEYLDDEYFRPSLISHVQEFLKVEPKLHVSMTPDMERLVCEQTQTNIVIETQRDQIEEMQKQVNQLKTQLGYVRQNYEQNEQVVKFLDALNTRSKMNEGEPLEETLKKLFPDGPKEVHLKTKKPH